MQKKPTGWFLGGVIAFLAACESGYKSAPAPGDSGRDIRDWRWSETGLDIEYREEPATDSAVLGEDVASLDAVLDAGEACVPLCEGRECGDDGCGGICGYCKYGFLCKAGLCIEY